MRAGMIPGWGVVSGMPAEGKLTATDMGGDIPPSTKVPSQLHPCLSLLLQKASFATPALGGYGD